MRRFYELFPDKEAAFVAALKLMLETSIDRMLLDRDPHDWEKEMRTRLRGLGELIDEQGPAARMCLLESYVAGAKSAAVLEQTIVGAEELLIRRLRETPERATMPPPVAVAAVGAVLNTIRLQLLRPGSRVADVMPPLLSMLFGFGAPTGPLRSAARPPGIRPEAAEASDHAERAMRALEAILTRQRYAEVTMEQVAEEARMSRRTLYANFSDRVGLLSAAIDVACAQVAAVMLPAYDRHAVPAEGLRAALGAQLALLASRPNLAHLLLIAAEEAGPLGLRRRARGLRSVRSLLLLIPSSPPGSPTGRVAADATLGGLLAMMRRRLLQAGPAGLPSLAPICTFVALAPSIGAEQATIAAEGRAYRRANTNLPGPLIRINSGGASHKILLTLKHGEAQSVTEIAEAAEIPLALTEAQIADLVAAGMLELREATETGEERRYRSTWSLVPIGEWSQIEQAERESASAQIGRAIEVEVAEAFEHGTFDLRPERTLVRIPAQLDEQGWLEISDALAEISERCLDIERQARERTAATENPADALSARVYIVSFEAAPASEE